MQEEAQIPCPFCGERIDILIDPSVERQTYIEDCSVCCRPIHIDVRCDDGAVISVETERS